MKNFGNGSGLFQLIDRKNFDALVVKWDMDKGVRSFSTWEMCCTLLSCMVTQLSSYRDAAGALGVPRSTLGDALCERSHGFFQDLCDQVLLTIKSKTKDRRIKKAIRKILAIDSTECRVHGSLFAIPGWQQRKTKDHVAALKLHVVWDINGQWIEDFRLSPSRRNDGPVCREFQFEPNKTYVFDRAYNSAHLWLKIMGQNAHFVTRLPKQNMTREELERVLPAGDGVLHDGIYSPGKTALFYLPQELRSGARFRHIIYRDPETKKVFHFITSDFAASAKIIAEIYRQRWAVELLFRWLKGHLNIRYLPSKNVNAAKTNLAMAVLVQLLLQLKKITDHFPGTLWGLLRKIRTTLVGDSLTRSNAPPDCRWTQPIHNGFSHGLL
jgi:hypothetical protein